MAPQYVVFVDGGARAHASAAGIVIVPPTGPKKKVAVKFGPTTNNEAEYLAVKIAFWQLQELAAKTPLRLAIYSDSKLVVNQLNGVWKVNKPWLQSYRDSIIPFTAYYDEVTFNWIPRKENTEADALTRELLDA